MSYESVWGIPFKELRSTGFRPLTDQAWAGVKTQAQLDDIIARAAKIGMTTVIEVSRDEIRGRYRYTCDLSPLRGRQLSGRWTLVPFHDLNKEEETQGSRKAISSQRRAGFAIFQNEAAAVEWKIIVTD
jgi:hypothetical protein